MTHKKKSTWSIKREVRPSEFLEFASGYATSKSAKAAAARAFKSRYQTNRVRIYNSCEPYEIYEATFMPERRVVWSYIK